MSDRRHSFKNILDDLLQVFPFPEVISIIEQLEDPLNCKDTAELLDVLERNANILRRKREEVENRYGQDREGVQGYVDNPNNFSNTQWKAIQKTKQSIRDYEREMDMALETGKIRQVVVEGRKKLKSRRKDRMRRFRNRKKWISM